MPIFDIFPQAIFYQQLEFDEKHLTELKDDIKNKVNVELGQHYFYQTSGDLENDQLYWKLKTTVENIAEEFYVEMGYKRTNMFVTQMWGNIMKGNGRISEHYHSNSLVSGVFYVDIDESYSGSTVFSEPLNGIQRMISIPIDHSTKYNTEKFKINVKKQMLVLFPSYLNHYSEHNVDKNERITISFNILPKNLGKFADLNFVNLRSYF